MMRRSLLGLVLASTACDDPSSAGDAWTAVPEIAYCESVADWDPAWADLEEQILAIVNDVRDEGRSCGSAGDFGPTHPLQMNPALRCAARKHSADMVARNFFEHDNPSGESPYDRMADAEYGAYSTAGENIAGGSPDAEGTMMQWLGSDGHCSNIMNPGFAEIGVGYSAGGDLGHLWTQDFATPQ